VPWIHASGATITASKAAQIATRYPNNLLDTAAE
jgi:hypothetical protein